MHGREPLDRTISGWTAIGIQLEDGTGGMTDIGPVPLTRAPTGADPATREGNSSKAIGKATAAA